MEGGRNPSKVPVRFEGVNQESCRKKRASKGALTKGGTAFQQKEKGGSLSGKT